LTVPDPFSQRQNRAAQLLAAYPHAAEMLGLYRQVLARQEPLYRRVLGSSWPRLGRGDAPAPPALGLDRLPFKKLSRPFRDFVAEVAGATPPALAAAGAAIGRAQGAGREELLRRVLGQDELGSLAASLGCEVPHLVFYARAFLQPIAEGLAARDPQAVEGGTHGVCQRCAWPPQVSVLRDEPEIKGRRYLVCSLCATWWIFTRSVCPSCGENDPTKLAFHENEATPYLRIEECTSCKAYIKSVDLRRDGFAVPLVDDLASVELDLWSEERDLWKISRNLLGM
jgi:formate dehydrogenase accessory protein FdhE